MNANLSHFPLLPAWQCTAQAVFPDKALPYMKPLEGYDAPTDAQLAVDLAALCMLSLLLQLFGVSEANCLLVRLWQTLKVKLVNLDGHPATGH